MASSINGLDITNSVFSGLAALGTLAAAAASWQAARTSSVATRQMQQALALHHTPRVTIDLPPEWIGHGGGTPVYNGPQAGGTFEVGLRFSVPVSDVYLEWTDSKRHLHRRGPGTPLPYPPDATGKPYYWLMVVPLQGVQIIKSRDVFGEATEDPTRAFPSITGQVRALKVSCRDLPTGSTWESTFVGDVLDGIWAGYATIASTMDYRNV